MRLRYSVTSPFARKVRTSAAYLGLPLELEIADTNDDTDTLIGQNPLGKLPVLLQEGEAPLFDSPVILEWLDHVAGGGRILPTDPKARFAALRLEALGDGLMDAALLVVYEQRFRPEQWRYAAWVERQTTKVMRTLDALEADIGALSGDVTVGTITLACALEYIDLRLGSGWRATRPGLVAWLEGFKAACPVFRDTAPPSA
ncbi:glutathione S-transferase N-terminal domain-containing protein [Aquabacter cavernae]|uniref:glutathione S-transferase N-terminal domain-containing protein n=1 Tax=Aquabacter cavernae TaxID=2496029 RepID=UPI000F8F537A|nr:glutathione S-transferase N-terminal domain-containing protein [Aquabacter cavernae]